MTRQPLRLVLLEAERVLATAAVPSPKADAESLAAHVLGVPRTKLLLTPLVDADVIERMRVLTKQRAARVPLQHIVGSAPMGAVDVAVGSGVFVPRPETELLLDWALAALADTAGPRVFDLCTGSGALALAVAAARPDAEVHAVELDPTALAWARHNADRRADAGDTRIRLHAGDVTEPGLLSEHDGACDLVVCNPPYVPEGAELPVEVAEHDPQAALFAGPAGLDVIRPVVTLAARLLRPGGRLAIEHDESNGEAACALLAARRVLTDVAGHPDLAGRPRFVTATRTAPLV